VSSRKEITQAQAIKRLGAGGHVWDADDVRFSVIGDRLHYEVARDKWQTCELAYMAEPFQDGPPNPAPATFEDALVHLRLGRRVKMSSWLNTAIRANDESLSCIYYWHTDKQGWGGKWMPLLDQLNNKEWLVERDGDWVSASERW